MNPEEMDFVCAWVSRNINFQEEYNLGKWTVRGRCIYIRGPSFKQPKPKLTDGEFIKRLGMFSIVGDMIACEDCHDGHFYYITERGTGHIYHRSVSAT
jgi:hypothetical protein